jgi:hypothetical protein
MDYEELSEEQILQKLLDVDNIPEKTYLLKRLGIPIKLKGLSGQKIFAIREQCTFKKEKRGRIQEDFDAEAFHCKLIVAATVSPKWDHPELLEKYKASSAEGVIKRMLLAGELANLGDAILELSGFDEDLQEIKNS